LLKKSKGEIHQQRLT